MNLTEVRRVPAVQVRDSDVDDANTQFHLGQNRHVAPPH